MNSPRHIITARQTALTRRWFLKQSGVGLGSIALANLLQSNSAYGDTTATPLTIKPPHFAAKAKRVIYLFMGGAPSQLELFDHKPSLARFEGKPPPGISADPSSVLLGPKFGFARHGHGGAEISELLPHLSSVADDLTIVRSMCTDASNHAPGQIQMTTGVPQFGRPSMGSWVTYGLGSESANLPAFVVFSTGNKNVSGGASCWGSGFLPSVHQGVAFRNSGDPILYLSNPRGITAPVERDSLDAIRKLNELKHADIGDPEIATRINSFELAYRMQTSAPELMDLSTEPQHILDLYGATPGKTSFAGACLLARRLAERGVRFIQIFHEAWDHHSNLTAGLKSECAKTDQPCAALLKDLKDRGMLDDTLVIWGGEFGRTATAQGGMDGRDHQPNCFSLWLAGGGTNAGTTVGESDELGLNVAKNPVHVNDLQATILRLLGLDHTKLTTRFQGRTFRLTDVRGRVIPEIIA
jgi:hypothetical protein